VLVHNTALGYSLEEQPKPSHAFPTVLKLVEAKQLSTPVISKLYRDLYDKKSQSQRLLLLLLPLPAVPHTFRLPPALSEPLVEADSYYVPFNPLTTQNVVALRFAIRWPHTRIPRAASSHVPCAVHLPFV
jgi:hypothetical protein